MAQKMSEYNEEKEHPIIGRKPVMWATIGLPTADLTFTFTKNLSDKEIGNIVNNKGELRKAIENGTIMLVEGFEKAYNLSDPKDVDRVINLFTKPFGVTYKVKEKGKILHE